MIVIDLKKIVNKKNDKLKFDIKLKTIEKYISVTYGCMRFIDSYRFLSSSLDSLVKTLLDNSHETLKDFKEQIADNDEILNFIDQIKILIKENIFKKDSFKDLKEDYPDNINESEEAILNYKGENDLKVLKEGFPDEWDYLTKKLTYPFDFFNSIDDYQKPIDHLRKADFFSKLEIECPEEIQRTMVKIKRFIIKNGEELTEIYLKSDVLLLASVFEKFIKVSVNKFEINPLYSLSVPGYTWQCGLKCTGINLQTLRDKDMILLLENIIPGGKSSVMSDRYVKSDEKKRYYM